MAKDDEVKQVIREMLGRISIEQLMKDVFFDGYDNFEDYRKYGDSFVAIKREDDDGEA